MEEWKDIPDYNGYQVSNLGNVRTFNKITKNKRYEVRHWGNKVLKPKKSTNKYGRSDYRVCLWKDGKPYTKLVARLVAFTFYKVPLDSELTVNHIDGNSLNNSLNNLEIITRKENIQHAYKTELYKNQIKIKLVNKITGTIIYPSSLNEGCKLINKCHDYLSYKIKNNIFEDDKYTWELI